MTLLCDQSYFPEMRHVSMILMAMMVIAMMTTTTMMICIMTEALLGWGPQGNAHKSVAPPSSLDHTKHHDHLCDNFYDDKIIICQSSHNFKNVYNEKFQLDPEPCFLRGAPWLRHGPITLLARWGHTSVKAIRADFISTNLLSPFHLFTEQGL